MGHAFLHLNQVMRYFQLASMTCVMVLKKRGYWLVVPLYAPLSFITYKTSKSKSLRQKQGYLRGTKCICHMKYHTVPSNMIRVKCSMANVRRKKSFDPSMLFAGMERERPP